MVPPVKTLNVLIVFPRTKVGLKWFNLFVVGVGGRLLELNTERAEVKEDYNENIIIL